MEKKTFTSLAIITFLMTSTAVVAMEEEKSGPRATGLTVQPKVPGEEAQPSSSVPATPANGGLLSALNPLNYWPFASTSTPSALPPAQGEKEGEASKPPSAVPAEVPGQSLTPVGGTFSPTEEELVTMSMSLRPDQLEQLLLAKSPSDAAAVLSTPTSTVPSSAPVETLTSEQESGLRWLWRTLFGRSTATTEVPPVEETKGASTSTGGQPSSSSIDSTPPVKTFRTTGINPNAMNKHSAISIQLPNQQLQDDMYTLVINHRTNTKGSQVRTYAPKDGKLNILGDLPLSATFSDMSFNLTPWVQSIREEGSLETNIAAYLTFADGQSDIHSFTIQPKGSSLMTVILGDKDSEAQSGIHVYAPETDGDTNDWSKSQTADGQ